jgi:hypothetical protein
MATTTTHLRPLETVRAEHDAVKEQIRALTIRRAQREVENPELFRYYDDEHKALTIEIERLYGHLGDLAREMASAEGRLLTFACAEALFKDHRDCRGEFRSNGVWMKCACACHTAKPDRKEE